MKMYKKIATIAPIAVLSTSVLFSPAMSFAAEKHESTKMTDISQQTNVTGTTSQTDGIKGYIIKNGTKTPVSTNKTNSLIKNRVGQTNTGAEAPYPELSANPTDKIPDVGETATETGPIGSVLYFSKLKVDSPDADKINQAGGIDARNSKGITISHYQNGYMTNAYIEKKSDGSIDMGTYDPSTLERYSEVNAKAIYGKTPDTPLFTLNPSWKDYFSNTNLKRESAFYKIGSGVQPKNASFTYAHAVTSGLTTADATSMASTVGAKIGGKAGDGKEAAEMSSELSMQLTSTFTHTITVTEQTTNTQTQGITKAAASYKNDQYAAALYQLRTKYTVEPGANLADSIKKGEAVLNQTAFSYNDSTLYLAVTPGAGA